MHDNKTWICFKTLWCIDEFIFLNKLLSPAYIEKRFQFLQIFVYQYLNFYKVMNWWLWEWNVEKFLKIDMVSQWTEIILIICNCWGWWLLTLKTRYFNNGLDYNELCWVKYDIKGWESPSPLKKFIIMCPQDSEPFVIHACHLKFSRYFLPFFWIKFLIDVQRFKFHHAVLRQFDDDPLRFNFSPELCK